MEKDEIISEALSTAISLSKHYQYTDANTGPVIDLLLALNRYIQDDKYLDEVTEFIGLCKHCIQDSI